MSAELYDDALDSATIRMRDPVTGRVEDLTLGDLGPYPIWSAGTAATTQSADLTVFRYAQSENVPGTSTASTHFDTNMQNAKGELEAIESMVVYALRVMLPAGITLADIKDIHDKVTLKFFVGPDKPFYEAHAALTPAGGGAAGYTTQNAAELWTNGAPSQDAVRSLARPFGIKGGRAVRATYLFGSALSLAATRKFVLFVDGMRSRIVQ